MLFFYVKEMF